MERLFLLLFLASFSTAEDALVTVEGQRGPDNMETGYNVSSATGAEEKLNLDDVRNISILAGNSSIFSNITHRGFLHGFGESISVILVSEIGDKTFFIAAILAMRNNKLVVFLAAITALYLMTILSGLLGWVVTTFIPREVTYYTCTAIMFLFGFKMLWEAWKMDENEAEEVQREVEEELARRGSIRSNIGNTHQMESQAGTSDQSESNAGTSSDQSESNMGDPSEQCSHENSYKVETDSNKQVRKEVKSDGTDNPAFNQDESKPEVMPVQDSSSTEEASNATAACEIAVAPIADVNSGKADGENRDRPAPKQGKRVDFVSGLIDRSCKENSWFGKKCLKIFKLFVNTFTMTFIAEWGDRSQLATIVLVGFNDVGGVIVGGCLGHSICTAGAVLAGALIARYVSVRKVTFLGALVFLGFAIASIFISPEEDGIEGIPDINGYDNLTRLINHNISLTLKLINIKDEDTLYDTLGSDYAIMTD